MAAARRRQDSYSTATVAVRHRSRSKNESLNQRFQGGPAEKSAFLSDLYYAGGYYSVEIPLQTSKFHPGNQSPGKKLQQSNRGVNESNETNIHLMELPTNETSKYSTQKSNFRQKHCTSQQPKNNQHYMEKGIEAIPEQEDQKLEKEFSCQSNADDFEGAI